MWTPNVDTSKRKRWRVLCKKYIFQLYYPMNKLFIQLWTKTYNTEQ
jgi:hypothetical protein